MTHTSTLDLSKHPEWATPEIKSTARGSALYSWLFAIAWNAFVGIYIFFAHEQMFKAFNDQPIFWIFAVFPLAGLTLFILAIKETLSWRHYGQTPLTMNPHPGQIGGVVGGHIDFDIDYTDKQEVIVSLSCVEYYSQTTSDGPEITSKTLWHDTTPLNTTPTAEGSRVKFRFTPDKTLPETQGKKKYDRIEWVLEAEIRSIQPVLKRQFKIPVTLSSDADIAKAERYTPSSNSQTNQDLSENHNTPSIARSGDNVRFTFPDGDNQKLGLGFVATAVLTSLFAVFILPGFNDFVPTATYVMAITIGLIVLILICVGLFIATFSITCVISSKGIKVSTRVLGMNFQEDIAAGDIVDLTFSNTGSSGDGKSFSASYSIEAQHRSGETVSLGGNLTGVTLAKQVRQKMLDALGCDWKPATQINEPQQFATYLRLLPKPIIKIVSFLHPFRNIIPLILPLALLYDARHFIGRMFNELEGFL